MNHNVLISSAGRSVVCWSVCRTHLKAGEDWHHQLRIGVDKVATHEWLSRHGFPTVRQASPTEVLRVKRYGSDPPVSVPNAESRDRRCCSGAPKLSPNMLEE